MAGIVVCVAFAGLAALAITALVAWPRRACREHRCACARRAAGFAGEVTAVDLRSATGDLVPSQLRSDGLWPLRQVDAGERVTIEVTVSRPDWAGWLVGRTVVSRFTTETPSAHVRADWLQVKSGDDVTVTFDHPIQVVSLEGSPARTLATPQSLVSLR